MNKDEIKKALECCCGYEASCDNCPNAKSKGYGCKDKLLANVHNLITEQEKEIDLLKMQLQDAVNHGNTFLEEAQKFEAENKKLKDEKRDIQVGYTEYALKEDERLEKLRNEIGELKQQNRKLFDDNMANYKKLKKEERKAVKQAKIDVLNELKEKCKFDGHTVAVYKNDIEQMIEELKK